MTSNPKIGPHEEIELELMKVNQKKIALFDFFPEEFREPCDNGEISLIFSKIKSRRLCCTNIQKLNFFQVI